MLFSFNEEERILLLDCINNYLGHLNFVRKNKDRYELNFYVSSSLLKDIDELEVLRTKLFCVEIEEGEVKKL